MRVLKYAILGLLDKGNLSGYDITYRFQEEIGHFWSANHSQIYPELRKLTQEGFIEFETLIQGVKLEKKMYSITDKGRQELHGWLVQSMLIPQTLKDAFMLKAYFFSSMHLEEAKQQFLDQLKKRREKLTYLNERMNVLEKNKDFAPSPLSPHFGHYLVLTRAIEREQGYILWLEKSLAAMEQENK